MYGITTEHRYVLKIDRSTLSTKIRQRIVYRFSGTYVSDDLKELSNNKNWFKKGNRFCTF